MPHNVLNALVVSNGIEGLKKLYTDTPQITYSWFDIGLGAPLNLSGFDVLIAPNGTDHVALYRNKEAIAAFLEAGGAVCCFDGWFTDWVPGNRWIMDNTRKTIDVRYHIKSDEFGLAAHFNIKDLNFSHGISGWWACGYIEPAPQAVVVMEDTWQRPLMVIDQASTNGCLVLTASGPLAPFSYATTDDELAYKAMADCYHAIVDWLFNRRFAAAS